MKTWIKRVLIGAGAVIGTVVVVGGGYAYAQASAFDESMDKVYAVPVPPFTRSSEPDVLARGKHLVESVAACASADCHGVNLAGGKSIEAGPLGVITAPNITGAGLGAAYSDGEIARLIRHGLKKDGRSLRFMPSHEINWLPDADVTAIVSHIRTLPAVPRPNGPFSLGLLAKILDRHDQFVIDVARRIDHDHVEIAPEPTPTSAYGKFLALGCTGCHGKTFGGGPIPGAPASMPVPLNITPDATGLKGWSYEDFDKLLTTGIRKNGKKLDPFMPIADIGKANELEKRALWEYLVTLPPKTFGSR
jgi:hypothetical protein